jgi:hypothetical protein
VTLCVASVRSPVIVKTPDARKLGTHVTSESSNAAMHKGR